MKDNGITLTELVVVMSIIAILVIALGFSFQGWQSRYKVESATKQVYSDMMEARARAMQMNRSQFVDFPGSTSYRVLDDVNGDGVWGTGDRVLPTFPKRLDYRLANWSSITYSFDKRGLISNSRGWSTSSFWLTIIRPPDGDPDYNCVTLSQTRIRMGLWVSGGTSCAEK